MSTAELTAHKIYDTYRLGELPDDVKRQLVILFMSTPEQLRRKSYTDIIDSVEDEIELLSEDSPINMTTEAISRRLSNAEAEAIAGKGLTSEEVHKRIDSKYPWLCD